MTGKNPGTEMILCCFSIATAVLSRRGARGGADAAPEVIDAERTGRLVPYGDPEALAPAITELLADPPLRRAWGAEAMRQARERFGYERFRRDLLSALELDAV